MHYRLVACTGATLPSGQCSVCGQPVQSAFASSPASTVSPSLGALGAADVSGTVIVDSVTIDDEFPAGQPSAITVYLPPGTQASVPTKQRFITKGV